MLLNKQTREAQIEVIKKMSDSEIINFIVKTTKTKRAYDAKLKTVKSCLKDLEEKIKMAENIKALREAGIGKKLALFGEAL